MSMELLYNIIEFVACFIDGFGTIFFLVILCGKKKNVSTVAYVCGVVVSVFGVALIPYYVSNVNYQLISTLFVTFLFGCFFIGQDIGKKVYFIILWNVILMVSNLFVIYGATGILKIDRELIVARNSATYVFVLIAHKLLLMMITIIVISYNKKYRFDYRQWIITVVQFFSVLSVGAIFINMYMNNLFRDEAKLDVIVIAIILSVMCLVVCICQHVLNVQNIYKVENEKLKTYLHEEEKNIKRIEELYENSNIIRHDLKHYAVMMKTLISANNFFDLEEMIDGMCAGASSDITAVFTKDTTLNAVLNDKLSVCKKHNINFQLIITCHVPKKISTDICVILSNLLDNAIEAEKKESDGYIKLYIKENGDMLSINVQNKITGSVFKQNPELMTTKKNKKEHGFGTKSISKRVSDMDGVYVTKEGKGEFTTIIRIPIGEMIYN